MLNNEICFGVFYTDDGLKSLNNKICLDILKIVSEKNVTLADLSQELHISPSTILFNIGKMEDKRIIGTFKDEKDRRKVYYAPIAHTIVLSDVPNVGSEPLIEEISKMTANQQSNFFENLYGAGLTIALRVGLNFGQMVDSGGRLIAHMLKNNVEGMSSDEALDYALSYYNKTDGPRISLISKSPIKFKVEYDMKLYENIGCGHHAGTGLICGILEEATGNRYFVDGESVSDDNTVAYFSLKKGPHVKKYLNTLYDPDGFLKIGHVNSEAFRIIPTKNGMPALVDNSLQIGIIDVLQESPASLKTLHEILKGPQSTLFSNLAKLEEREIICYDKDLPGSNIYKLYGHELLSSKSIRMEKPTLIKEIINEAVKDPSKFYRTVFRHNLLLMDEIGIDMHSGYFLMGCAYGKACVNKYRNKKTDEILKSVCNEKNEADTIISLDSFVPLQFSLKSPLFGWTGRKSIMQYYVGLVSEIIFMTTGRVYVQTNLEDFSDDDGVPCFRFCMELR